MYLNGRAIFHSVTLDFVCCFVCQSSSIASNLDVDVTELVRLNQKIWGPALTRKSKFKEGTEVVLPCNVSAEAVSAARDSYVRAADFVRLRPVYVAAEDETPRRYAALARQWCFYHLVAITWR